MAPLDFSIAKTRSKAADFSEFFSTDDVIIITKTPGMVERPFLLLEVFTPLVRNTRLYDLSKDWKRIFSPISVNSVTITPGLCAILMMS